MFLFMLYVFALVFLQGMVDYLLEHEQAANPNLRTLIDKYFGSMLEVADGKFQGHCKADELGPWVPRNELRSPLSHKNMADPMPKNNRGQKLNNM